MQDDFFKYQAQTTPHPLAMVISHAKGSYIYDTKGKAYLDFVAGVSSCSLGHSNPKVVNAVKAESTLENEAAVIPKIKLIAANVPNAAAVAQLIIVTLLVGTPIKREVTSFEAVTRIASPQSVN